MSEEKRELVAIMFTDIVGYTALSQHDERLALELLQEHSELLREHFHRHGGREIKALGDGFLVEFPSALQATECAVEIQRALKDRNVLLPPERRIQVRIGLHLGDVVRRGEDVLGDAVNIASRLQALAEPGGICLSGQVYAQVWNKLGLKLTSLGRKRLKNVQAPLEVYRVILKEGSGEVSTRPGGRWRIAVLPFANISPNPADEYFSDGMTEELIHTLSKISKLRVIAFTSVVTYKRQPKRVSEVGRELGVGMVVEGSVRKAGDRLRITIQLVDADTEEHLWAQVYDRELKDVFAVQSDIAQQVARALEVEVLGGEEKQLRRRPTRNLEAYKLYLQGRYALNMRTEEALKKAIRCFEEAIQADPRFALAYTGLANVYSVLPFFRPVLPVEAFPRAKEAALRALELDATLAEAHTALGEVFTYLHWDRERAESAYKEAIRLKPGYASAHTSYGALLMRMFEGRLNEAKREIECALELDPLSLVANVLLAWVFADLGELEKSLDLLQKLVELFPYNPFAWMWLGQGYARVGRYSQAITTLEKAKMLPGGWMSMAEALLGYAHARSGEEQRARQVLAGLLRRAKEGYVPSTWISALYAALGEKEECLAWLARAREVRDVYLPTMHAWPAFDLVRRDPRFQEFRAELGLTPG